MFNDNCHLEGELVSLCNVPAHWTKSVSDFFCLSQYLLAYFFIKKLSSGLGKS